MATNLKNKCFNSAIGKTTNGSTNGEKPILNFVKIFGCEAYRFVEKQFCKKLDKISKRGHRKMSLGTSKNSKVYMIGIENEGKLKVQTSRNVSFDRSKFYFGKKKIVFFENIFEKIPKSATEALPDSE